MTSPIRPGVTLSARVSWNPTSSAPRACQRRSAFRNTAFSDIVRGRRGITADTALRLEWVFGVSASFWLNLQSRYELEVTKRDAGSTIRKTVKRLAGAA